MSYGIKDLVKVAKRENNSKRPYLYVNPLQGKHIPVSPDKVDKLCENLAYKIDTEYPQDKILIVGFAETATAIATGVALNLENAVYFQCTTREKNEKAEFVYFTESHSHATEQKLDVSDYVDLLRSIDRIVFVEDEVTTGNTICKLINIMKKEYAGYALKYSIASILNSMDAEREAELEKEGIRCIYLARLPFEYCINKLDAIEYDSECIEIADETKGSELAVRDIRCDIDQRVIGRTAAYRQIVNRFAETIYEEQKDKMKDNVLILGTEEFMYPAIYLGKYIQQNRTACNVKVHATTRSPILPSKVQEYPLYKRYQLKSVYANDRITYIYNLEKYDCVLIVSDTHEDGEFYSLYNVLKTCGNEAIAIYRWRR